jgi:hypothetical protein
MKRCVECGELKPLAEFNKDSRRSDGRQDRCRACFSAYNKSRYLSDPDRFKQAVSEYKANNPDAVFATRLAVWKKHCTRENTYRLVDAAVAAGVITVPSYCSVCGQKMLELADGRSGLHAHHFDYDNPLSVVWVCVPCHAMLHKLMRARQQGPKTPEEALVYFSINELTEVLGTRSITNSRQEGRKRLTEDEYQALQHWCREWSRSAA